MRIESAEFVKSVTAHAGLPKDGLPEIAFVGRSNVGKSSMLNALTEKKGLARTSGTPGKTREINYFLVNQKFYFVDLPGYGYAKVSKTEQEKWRELIASYLQDREELKLVVLIIDARHPNLEIDLEMQEFLYFYGRRYAVVRTKADKLNQSETVKAKRLSEASFKHYEFIADFSAATGSGKSALLTKLQSFLTH
ncbi:MAG: YihA family ribosome biogenesis GTP-binding protein [Rhizobacter sp.]|nr:YihA family ribosome biogenesis GTP-binding protein [Chlorobiales bacterium]